MSKHKPRSPNERKARFCSSQALTRTKRTKSPRVARAKLPERSQGAPERALNLLSDLRRRKGSYSELLRKHRLGTRTAHKYLGRDLLGGSRGKPVRASKADRRVRLLMFPKDVGDVPIRTRSSRAATKLSEIFSTGTDCFAASSARGTSKVTGVA